MTVMCTTLGHENREAVGEAQVDEECPGWFPYCRSCLLRGDPPVNWWPTAAVVQASVGGVLLDGEALTNAVTERLFGQDALIRAQHHTYPQLDANARRLIAEIAVDALFQVIAGH